MSTSDRCTDVRASLPELALGSLTGQERARALEHVAGCSACRRELQVLSEVGDELLTLVPEAEPPVGFESRVIARLGERDRRPRRMGAVAAALALVAALIGGSAVYVATRADRDVADSYRRTLEVAGGRYFAARPLQEPSGSVAGHVFGYQGSPSWVFCVVDRGGEAEAYEIRLTSTDGREWTLGEMRTEEGSGTWARSLPVDLHDVATLEFVQQGNGTTLVTDWSSE